MLQLTSIGDLLSPPISIAKDVCHEGLSIGIVVPVEREPVGSGIPSRIAVNVPNIHAGG